MDNRWMDDARCREVGSAVFFPEEGDYKAVQRARQICRDCEVQAECLTYGMAEIHGIWGGTTVTERRQLRKKERIA
jgi:WhiB family redox-sensing transcriptional regulator